MVAVLFNMAVVVAMVFVSLWLCVVVMVNRGRCNGYVWGCDTSAVLCVVPILVLVLGLFVVVALLSPFLWYTVFRVLFERRDVRKAIA